MTDFKINVIVDPAKADSGIDKTKKGLDDLDKRGKRLRRTLTSAFTLVAIAAAVREITRMADALTNAQNRIRLVTTSTRQLNAVTQQLFDIANRTRTAFESTATIYSRTALAVKNLGLTQREVLNFTQSLNQAIVLSGVSAQEANAGLIQLSQGLASGTLRGDELRSVLEQLPKVADVIAQELQVTRGELRLLGQQGQISAKEVITAFVTAADELDAAFAESIPTISQGFSVLRSEFIRFIGDLNSATGASEKFARLLILLADNLDIVAKGAVIAGVALAVPFAKDGVIFATRAVIGLTAAIAANPVGLLLVGLAAGITALTLFADEITVTADGFVTLGDVMQATFDFIMQGVQPVIDTLVEGFDRAITFITGAFGIINLTMDDVIKFTKVFINRFIGFYVGLGNAMRSIFSDIRQIIIDVVGQDLLDNLGQNLKRIIGFVVNGFKVIQTFAASVLTSLGLVATTISATVEGLELPDLTGSLSNTLFKVGANAKTAFLEGFDTDFIGNLENLIVPALREIDEAARKIAAERRKKIADADAGLDERPEVEDRIPFALREQLRLLDEEAKRLQLTNRERGIQNELLKLEEKLRSSNTTLSIAHRELLELRIRNTTALREQADVMDSIRSPQEALMVREEALTALYAKGAISLSELNHEMTQLVLSQSQLNIAQGEGTFVDGFLVGIESMLESVRNFRAEAGMEFGAFFTQASEGFSQAAADAIVFGTSFTDAVGNAARQAVASLLAGLIKLGVQYVLNAALGETLAATATAAGVAQAATLATAFATPAALVSLSSFGANAAPATAGIASTIAFAQTAAVIPGFADGGFVSGPGGPRDDRINANLSNGEFVVNARATSRFRPQLEAINDPSSANSANISSEASGSDGGSQSGSGASSGGVNIINVLDPSLVEDFMTSSQGDQVVVNTIERNAASINQVLRNN